MGAVSEVVVVVATSRFGREIDAGTVLLESTRLTVVSVSVSAVVASDTTAVLDGSL